MQRELTAEQQYSQASSQALCPAPKRHLESTSTHTKEVWRGCLACSTQQSQQTGTAALQRRSTPESLLLVLHVQWDCEAKALGPGANPEHTSGALAKPATGAASMQPRVLNTNSQQEPGHGRLLRHPDEHQAQSSRDPRVSPTKGLHRPCHTPQQRCQTPIDSAVHHTAWQTQAAPMTQAGLITAAASRSPR